ncbi:MULTISPECIES: hypothetical protein [unclassified Streptomyces]|uniref:hypothetical protein n=1 Tax=unclassified Streptomyces TaxID=2593676 RepID=UPI0006AE09B4|nr:MULTISPECIES: hypothetical protein [unclassified Streptomyces]KOU79926.1 hypothetical protein ADK93_34365 [Streptomyces sp. XY58]KOV12150.1 hypothetical protein ADK89_02765 [Streptomyces sp. XY37]KOV43450.1 hypothetical protein ADK99_28555 [Streptomyces sp. MMG1064]
MKRISRWYTSLTADGRPLRFASAEQPGTVIPVRRPDGRVERFRLTDTPLYGPHRGTLVADRVDYL